MKKRNYADDMFWQGEGADSTTDWLEIRRDPVLQIDTMSLLIR